MADVCEVLRESLRERELEIKRLEKEVEAPRIVLSIQEERSAREAKPDVTRPFAPQRVATEPDKSLRRLP
jgi:hypothetical protein